MARGLSLTGLAERIGGRALDWWFGVKTEAFFLPQAIGLPDGGFAYHASDWFTLRRALLHVGLQQNDVFLDYGCGLGRALITAARWPCRRVVGLEYSSHLAEGARANLAAAAPKLRCRATVVVQADVREFMPPPDVTVAYFYNPFSPELLAIALDRLRETLVTSPRTLRVLFRNPHYLEQLAASRPWLLKLAEYANLGQHRYVVYQVLL